MVGQTYQVKRRQRKRKEKRRGENMEGEKIGSYIPSRKIDNIYINN